MTPLDALPIWIVLPVAIFLVVGSTLTLLGAVGLFHLKKFYDRVHVATLGTSWGAAAILLSSILAYSWVQGRVITHEFVIGAFVMITTPVTYMLLCRAALNRDQFEGSKDVPPLPAPEAPPLSEPEKSADEQRDS